MTQARMNTPITGLPASAPLLPAPPPLTGPLVSWLWSIR